MPQTTSEPITHTLATLRGMVNEINLKKRLLSYQLGEGPSKANLEKIKNTSIVLTQELENINICLDFIENIMCCFKQKKVA